MLDDRDTPRRVRDYGAVVRRVEAAGSPRVSVGVFGEADGYPILGAKVGRWNGGERRILITGGVHGDEPAGTEAAVRFLEEASEDAPDPIGFLVLPCLNPWGYEHDSRENKVGLDVNRSMRKRKVRVVNLAKRILAGRRFDLAMDLHEDFDADGFYLYEPQNGRQGLGARIAEAVRPIGPVGNGTSDEDIRVSEGVLAVDPKWGDVGFSTYVYIHHSDHAIIAETASKRPMEERVAMHLRAIEVAVNGR
jgi:hypothetical protein